MRTKVPEVVKLTRGLSLSREEVDAAVTDILLRLKKRGVARLPGLGTLRFDGVTTTMTAKSRPKRNVKQARTREKT